MDVYRDLFTREELVLAIEKAPFIPGQMAQYFDTIPDVTTTDVLIDELGLDSVTKSDAKPRGAPADPMTLDKDKTHSFRTQMFSKEIPILADSVLNARNGGTVNPMILANKRDKATRKLRRWTDIQHEWLRISCINAPSNAFGNAPADVQIAFGNADSAIRAAIFSKITKPLEAALNGIPYSGADVWCSDDYWEAFIESKTIKDTYMGWSAAVEQRGLPPDVGFQAFNCTWNRYRPSGDVKIPDGKAKVIPRGVDGLLVQAFAPDDTMSSVGMGESGQPYYLRSFDIPDDKGFRLKMQTHPVMVCTRPSAILTLKLTA